MRPLRFFFKEKMGSAVADNDFSVLRTSVFTYELMSELQCPVCVKEYEEGAWRCEAWIEGKCKILFPRINLLLGSDKWLGILSCTLPWHGVCCVCVLYLHVHIQATHESAKGLPLCLALREN